ncbi:hypothetical protein PMZ80_005183 [Knufia obscura]|uniref:BTB domain-containing protein n=1 Tax=Knufia obscura TaxID=1635080 RepID=A0ABR0RQU9_9EURO|nr:hypothetical protein PMZ80_005183 [Knufia obscura]
MDWTKVDYTSTFTIILEDTGARYLVHKDIFCVRSDFFKGCLRKDFVEGQKEEVTIKEETDERSMQLLISWTYRGKEILSTAKDNVPDTSVRGCDRLPLTRLYLLADKLLMTELKNDIVDSFINLSHKAFPDLQALALMLEIGPDHCQLKRFMIDDLVWDLKHRPGLLEDASMPWSSQLQILLVECPELPRLLLKPCLTGWMSDQTVGRQAITTSLYQHGKQLHPSRRTGFQF